MPDTGSEQSNTTWPLAKFQFSVTIGNSEALFQEVTGLNEETQPIEYRHADSKLFSPVKMPGIEKYGNLTLRNGIFKADKDFKDLYEAVKMNAFDKKIITIALLDETGKIVMTWQLANAFPSKITITDLKSDGNEMAVESMELAYEGLTLSNK